MQPDEMQERISRIGLQRTQSDRLEWNKEHDEYPRNWPVKRKALDIGVLVFLEFYTLSVIEARDFRQRNMTDDSKHCNQYDRGKLFV